MLPIQKIEDILVEYSPTLSLQQLKSLIARYEKVDESIIGELFFQSTNIAVLSNYSTQFFVKGLRLALASKGINSTIYEAEYDQWEHELLDPSNSLKVFRPDIVLLTLTSQSLIFRYSSLCPEELADHIADMIEQAQSRLKWSRFVVTLPEPLEEELDQSIWSFMWRKDFIRKLRNRLTSICLFIDLEPLIRDIGHSNWYSGRFFITAKMMCNPNVTARYAEYLGHFLKALLTRSTKLVVLDLDNTLWGGVVGEVGWQNIDLDYGGKGLAYLRLQRFLLGLYNQGILLAILSKNNKDDAMEVFEKRTEMILKPKHFADMQINWEPKSKNLDIILKNLNLSSAGVVFLDDSHFEREEIRYSFPDIVVPDFPEEPHDFVTQLVRSGQFMIVSSNKEDSKRQESYKLERQRNINKTQSNNLTEFYRSLELALEAQAIQSDNKARTLDLLSKTNQFNLTTRRHSPQVLEHIVAIQGAYSRVFHLRDKFGNYGLIGVILTTPQEDTVLVVDSWVLSCRAMGRTVENAMFYHLSSVAKKQGIVQIIGEYIPTQKNAPVKDLFLRLGFKFFEKNKSSNGDMYMYDLNANGLPSNEFVNLI
jgi:FkbH-like protein